MTKRRTDLEQQAYEGRMKLLSEQLRKMSDILSGAELASLEKTGFTLDPMGLRFLDDILAPETPSKGASNARRSAIPSSRFGPVC